MIKINLLPVRAKKKKEELIQQAVVFVVSLLILAAGIAYAHFDITAKVAAVDQKIVEVNQEIEKAKKDIEDLEKIEKDKAEIERKLKVINDLKVGRNAYVKRMDDFSKVLPDTVWITTYSDRGANFKMDGMAQSNETIAKFLVALEQSPYFKDVELTETVQAEFNKVKVKKFGVVCKTE